jgi:signal transduction histidine kinase
MSFRGSITRHRLGLRGRIWLNAVAAIAIVLAVLTVGFNVLLSSRLDAQAGDLAVARASAELAALSVSSHGVALAETADAAALDSPLWVFSGHRAIEHPVAARADQRAASALALGPRRQYDVAATETRMYALPIIKGARRVGTVVSAVSLRSGAQTVRTALFASIALAALVLLAVAVATHWLVARALAPVGRMTAQAEAWSERDLDRRFELGEPHDEFTGLAAVLDRLLDRIAASLRREQRLTAELAHELRTPLATISAEAQYALRHGRDLATHRASHERVNESAASMSRTVETLIAAARSELDPGRATSEAAAGARAAAALCRPLAAELGIEIEANSLQANGTGLVAAEASLVERIVAPLLENGCRHARARVSLSVEREPGFFRYVVHDDGLGIDATPLEAIFEPGRVGPRGPVRSGAGLGLPLARRLARSAGGEISAVSGSDGATFFVVLPAA